MPCRWLDPGSLPIRRIVFPPPADHQGRASCLSQHPSSLAHPSRCTQPVPCNTTCSAAAHLSCRCERLSAPAAPGRSLFPLPARHCALPAPLRFDDITRANVDKTTCTPPSWPWFLRLSLSSLFPETFPITFRWFLSGGTHGTNLQLRSVECRETSQLTSNCTFTPNSSPLVKDTCTQRQLQHLADSLRSPPALVDTISPTCHNDV